MPRRLSITEEELEDMRKKNRELNEICEQNRLEIQSL